MAWPLSRYRDHVANTTVIGADVLNALQDQDIAIASGTGSVKALTVDGTGGAAATPVAGTVQVSRTVGDANEPSGNTTAKGQINQESIPTAKASISGGFQNVIWGYGIHSVARWGGGAANGDYEVILQAVPSGGPTADRSVVHVTALIDAAHDRIVVSKSLDGSNRLKLRVTFKNAGVDIDFDLTATVM